MRNWVRAAIAALLLGGSASLAGVAAPAAAAITASDLPTSMHGAVETQAVTVGNGAAALFVDPGTAYAYSTLDRDDYGEGSESYTMTARGANLNLGVIALAVLWAAPECRAEYDGPNFACVASGQVAPGQAPNTGLHEAKGFPAYAEALYPPPPADTGALAQDRVYKCIVNKDGPGSPPSNGTAAQVCKTSDGVPLTAWAEAVGEEYRATGFSRAAGTDLGLAKVANNESFSDVRPIGGGKVVSQGFSALHNISLLGGQISIDAVRSAARVVGSPTESARSVSCTFSGLRIEGQAVETDGHDLPADQLKPLLDGVAEATGYVVEILPPTLISEVQEGGKQFVGCSGLVVRFTDTHTASPVPVCLPVAVDPSVPQCVPALANREEFSFGRITVQQSVNNTSFDLLGGLEDTLDVGGALDAGGGDSFSDLSATGTPLDDLGGADALNSGSTVAGSATEAGSGALGSSGIENTAHTVNAARLGWLAAASSLAWLIGILVLIGVINSLATGRRLRLPGF